MINTIQEIQNYVIKQIASLSNHLETGFAKARLAQLRRGIGKKPGENPEIWGDFLSGLPEQLMGRTDEPSRAEWAIYITLTMYALHQQGHAESVNRKEAGYSLGQAVGKLVKDEDDLERIQQRFRMMALSEDMTEFSYYLRCIVRLLSDADVPLDYTELSKEIFLFQFDDKIDSIRLKWGQDFYRQINHSNLEENEEEDEL